MVRLQPFHSQVQNSTFSQEKCISEVVRIGIIFYHPSKLWKAKFFILCDVIFLVRLQEKFEIDHSWELKGLTSSWLPTQSDTCTRIIETLQAPTLYYFISLYITRMETVSFRGLRRGHCRQCHDIVTIIIMTYSDMDKRNRGHKCSGFSLPRWSWSSQTRRHPLHPPLRFHRNRHRLHCRTKQLSHPRPKKSPRNRTQDGQDPLIHLSARPPVHSSVRRSIRSSVRPSIRPSVRPFTPISTPHSFLFRGQKFTSVSEVWHSRYDQHVTKLSYLTLSLPRVINFQFPL